MLHRPSRATQIFTTLCARCSGYLLCENSVLVVGRSRLGKKLLQIAHKLILLLHQLILWVLLALIVNLTREVAEACDLEQVEQLALVVGAILAPLIYREHWVLIFTSSMAKLRLLRLSGGRF